MELTKSSLRQIRQTHNMEDISTLQNFHFFPAWLQKWLQIFFISFHRIDYMRTRTIPQILTQNMKVVIKLIVYVLCGNFKRANFKVNALRHLKVFQKFL